MSFKPFDRVLIRVGKEWWADFYSHSIGGDHHTVGGGSYGNDEIIPYEGNEHLLGTSDSPKPKWQPKPGDLVAVANDKCFWYAHVFLRKEENGQFAAKTCADHEMYSLYKYCEPLREHFNVPEE